MPDRKLFKENKEDQKKNQSYKDSFKNYSLPEKYYLLEMYQKQKELQQFLVYKGKTEEFPIRMKDAIQKDVQLAIYHLFCMQVEYEEFKAEIYKLKKEDTNKIDARYELIDMFFFMFNVGIYTGLDIYSVVNKIENFAKSNDPINMYDTSIIDSSIRELLNYIDKLPWKAWKEYNYASFNFSNPEIITYYAVALHSLVEYAKKALGETEESLFNLYMNKWMENRRRQEDVNSGYILNSK